MGRDFTAWCECGDALEAIEIKDEKGYIDFHEYYCIGCDQTYLLVKKELIFKEMKKE